MKGEETGSLWPQFVTESNFLKSLWNGYPKNRATDYTTVASGHERRCFFKGRTVTLIQIQNERMSRILFTG